jgi:hypothetical protein
MTETTETAETAEVPESAAVLFTDADLALVARMCEAASELWPLYATDRGRWSMSYKDAQEYSIVGIDADGDAIFQSTDYDGRTSDTSMPMQFVLDNQHLVADAKAQRERLAQIERAAAEAKAAERRAQQQRDAAAAKARQEAADLAAFQRVQDRIARGEITAPGTGS